MHLRVLPRTTTMRFPENEDKKCIDDCEDEEDCSWASSSSNAPDGGWGWVVLAASFVSIAIVDGVCFSFGVLMLDLIDILELSHSQIGWIGSTLAGTYLLVGPFVSALCARFSCRKVTIAGAVVASLGFALSALNSNLEWLVFTYGVIAGIGFGMIYLPSIVVVGYWFERKRALTTGIALCGSGVGGMIFAPLTTYLLEQYTWQGHNLIIAGIVLNCAVCGMLFFPLDKCSVDPQKPMITRIEMERGAIMKALIEEKSRQRTISTGSLDNCIITRDNKLIKLDPKIFIQRNNSFIAKFKKQLGFSSQSLEVERVESIQGIPSIVIDAVQRDLKTGKTSSPIYRPNGTRVQQLSQQSLQSFSKRGSLPEGTNLPDVASSSASCQGFPNGSTCNGMPKTRSWNVLPNEHQNSHSHLNGGMSLTHVGTPPDVTRSATDLQSSNKIQPLDSSVISIQLIRNGACGGASNRNLRQRSSHSVGDYSVQMAGSQSTYITGSVMSMPQIQASLEEFERQCAREQSLFWRSWNVFCEMIDLKLLLNPVFALLVVSSFITLLAFFVPFFYLPEKGIALGMSNDDAGFLLSIVGITNTFGRVLAGWLADRPWINTLYFNNGALIIAGLALLMCPNCTNLNIVAVVAAIYGVTLAVFNSLRSIMLVELLGLETLTKSFGLLILFQGIAALIGAPIAGYISDVSGSTDNCFLVAGGLILVSGLIMFPIKCLQISQRGDRKYMMPYLGNPLMVDKMKCQSTI